MKRRLIWILLVLLYTGFNVYSQDESLKTDSTTTDTLIINNGIPDDSPIVTMLDSLVNIRFSTYKEFTTDSSVLNIYNYEPDFVPQFHDTIYEQRILLLNQQTPIELTYNNTIKTYIKLYAVKKRELTSRMLGLSEVYFPMFEEQLDRFDIPLELKYLAIVESALNPRAGSRAGAKGLWQFMYGTGKVYGLKVSSLIDERYDPLEATIAACEHLRDLYDIYDDWSLAMAAYNSGAGNVNKAIRRAGKVKNYWAVWPFLPRETRGYVPAFTAVLYVMNYAAEHNLYPVDPGILYYGIDTVVVNQPLSFDQISEMLDIPMSDIEFLNPMYKTGIIPSYNGDKYILRLPSEYIGSFIDNEDSLYNFKSTKGIAKDALLAEIEKAKSRKMHIVRYGENLGLIAKRYRCYVSQLKSWNGLRGNTIYPGQKLIVYSPHDRQYKSTTSSYSSIKRSGEKSYHTVTYGENLGLIAKRYNCTVTDLREWNNLRGSVIHPKQKLIVYEPASSTTIDKDAKFVYHTIKKGDTLWDIAKMYDGATVDGIKHLNNIGNTRKLKPGQRIKVAVVS